MSREIWATPENTMRPSQKLGSSEISLACLPFLIYLVVYRRPATKVTEKCLPRPSKMPQRGAPLNAFFLLFNQGEMFTL